MAEMWEVSIPVDPRKEGDKTIWLKTGVAFENKDGSFNLYIEALPRSGKLHMRKKKKREDAYAPSEEEPNF